MPYFEFQFRYSSTPASRLRAMSIYKYFQKGGPSPSEDLVVSKQPVLLHLLLNLSQTQSNPQLFLDIDILMSVVIMRAVSNLLLSKLL